MKSRFLIILAILAISLSACVSLAEDITPPPNSAMPTSRPTMAPVFPENTPDAANGATIYAEKCAACHGESGLGDGEEGSKLPNPVAALGSTKVAAQASPAEWFIAVTEGNLEFYMPPFASLTDQERWDVVAYAFSLSSSEEEIAIGEKIFQAKCAECHGEDGAGEVSSADFSNQSFMATRSAATLAKTIINGSSAGMEAYGEEFSGEEIAALTNYIRSFSFDFAFDKTAQEDTGTEAATEDSAETTADGEEQTETTAESDVDLGGKITGVVTNGSGGELPKGITIQLEAYDHDMSTGGFNKVFTLETALNTDGTYLFENVETLEGRAFLAVIEKDGVIYNSQPNFVAEGNTELELPIIFYETSTDSSELSIDRLHIFFEPPNTEAELAQVIEVFVVSNPSLYAIVAEEGKAAIEFVLPQGATNIQFEDSVFGERYTETTDGFGDTMPILPGIGDHEVVVFFELPFEKSFLAGNKLNFTQKISHPIDSAIVMAPQGLKVDSDVLQKSGEREAQGLVYNTYSSQALPIGTSLEMNMSGKVSANAVAAPENSQKNILYGLIALGLVLIGAGYWYYMRGDDDDEYDDDEEEDEFIGAEYEDSEKLMDAIIALDDAYRAGDLSESVYKKRRAELKTKLQELL
ncbi:MAG: c-type cytochrome [Chloroflexi bacterium]|nr:c-type cytochrome [Chloroflexota bacterium]